MAQAPTGIQKQLGINSMGIPIPSITSSSGATGGAAYGSTFGDVFINQKSTAQILMYGAIALGAYVLWKKIK